MTKVNYFGHTQKGTAPAKDRIYYSRSKKEALTIGNKLGHEGLTIENMYEMNKKEEVDKILNIQEMFTLRTEHKKLWDTPIKKSPKKEISQEVSTEISE
jgi:hypothetical protein